MKKSNICKTTKASMIISSLSYLIAYILSVVLYRIIYLLEAFVPGVFPLIDTKTCILSLVISINVISVLHFWSKQNVC